MTSFIFRCDKKEPFSVNYNCKEIIQHLGKEIDLNYRVNSYHPNQWDNILLSVG
jgi:hypothetical protein